MTDITTAPSCDRPYVLGTSVETALRGSAATACCRALGEEDHETECADGDTGPTHGKRFGPTVAGEQHHDRGRRPQEKTPGNHRYRVGEPATEWVWFRLALHEM